MNYEHRGTSIELDERKGTFAAVIAGKRHSAPSLASIKARIDKLLDGEFKSFIGLRFERYGNDLKEVIVTGIKKPRKSAYSYHNRPEWVLGTGETTSQVIENTPENRAAVAAWAAHKNEAQRIRKQQDEEQERLWEKVKRLKPPQHE